MSPNPAVVIVTGGSRGIGRSIVERLWGDGYAVLFTHSASDDEAAQVEANGRADGRPAVRGLRLDVTDVDAPRQVFDAAEAMGDVVGLVNNAGITGRLGRLEDLRDDTLQRLLAVNLEAPARLCREAAQRWKGGARMRHIVNLSSVAARTGSPGEYVVYAATKAAIETLSLGLARELADSNVLVNAVSPGTVDTSIHARAGEPGRAWRVAQRIPLGRPGRPEEVANAVAWLLSAESSYVTGSVLSVTGGL